MAITKIYNAGEDIDSYCGKCKLVLAHIILALKEEKPAKVECKTCNAKHAYKKSAPGTRKTSAGRRTSAAEKATKALHEAYDEAIDGKDLSAAKDYAMNADFFTDDIVDHTKFGLGIVLRTLSDSKIEVIFPVGAKVLVHCRS